MKIGTSCVNQIKGERNDEIRSLFLKSIKFNQWTNQKNDQIKLKSKQKIIQKKFKFENEKRTKVFLLRRARGSGSDGAATRKNKKFEKKSKIINKIVADKQLLFFPSLSHYPVLLVATEQL